jgi:hypothetical protein
MNDEECLLEELERWRNPMREAGSHAHVLAALESTAHQHLAERFRHALRQAPVRPPDPAFPAPC